MISNEQVINYKFVDSFEVSNFDIKVCFHTSLLEKKYEFYYVAPILEKVLDLGTTTNRFLEVAQDLAVSKD